jgi:Ca2+-binding RTX toxin-like protein
LAATLNSSDFLSLDDTIAKGTRGADGSLPISDFLHLSASSQLIDKGIDVGRAFDGAAPDLGSFETAGSGHEGGDVGTTGPGSSDPNVLKGTSVNDIFIVSSIFQTIVEALNEGWDKVVSSVSYVLNDNVEELALSGRSAINATGNGLDNRLFGNAGSNVLDGAGGADQMAGNAGDDVYVVDNSGDVVDEGLSGRGLDTVTSWLSFDLTDTAHARGRIEAVTLLGAEDLNASGNAYANTLEGNGGNNLLDGAGGGDLMRGRAGDDTYVVDSGKDIVDEGYFGGGIDTVLSSRSFSLADVAHAFGTLESLVLTGLGNVNGTGNGWNNSLVGNGGRNALLGAGGDDRLEGGASNDTLTGGAGSDTFVFAADFTQHANVDRIKDFMPGIDKIELHLSTFSGLAEGSGFLRAEHFTAGASAANADDRIVYDGASGRLSYDADGAGIGAAYVFAVLKAGLPLTCDDFFLV